ncbi:MAG: cytochrome c oxidase assembly protein [Acidimicrobiales bacterium]|nr:cytochrome c oxidase assembly protein [Acidimicrobiales bacterium]
MKPITWSVHGALTQWQHGPFALAVVAALIAVAYWYLRADWRLAARGRRWPSQRTAAFLAGLVAVDLALQSPVATFTAGYFEAHVVQHLLLMVVAPPLLALGAPSTLLLQTSSRRVKSSWLSVLRSKPFAALTFPLTVWSLYFGVMFAFFLSSLINRAMHDMALMDAWNLLFLLGGTLYWWPLVGLDPVVHWRMSHGARMVTVLLGAPPEVILGLALLSAGQPVASMYTLASTHAGGGLLWISTEFSTALGFIPIFWQWMRSDERAAARADARSDRQDELAGLAPEGEASAGSMPVTGAAMATAAGEPTAWEAYWRMRTGRVPARTAPSRRPAPAVDRTPARPDT